MLQFAKKLRAELGGGVLTSLALHLLVAALLLLQLPEWKTTPPETESVKVEVVPPPTPEPEPKPEPEKKEEPPKPQPAPAPAAAASSSQNILKLLPRSEKESTEEKKPPSGDGETQDKASTPQESETEQGKTDAAAGAAPIEAKPALPDTAELQSAPTPSETAGQAAQQSPAPTTSPKNTPVPQQKAQPQPKKTDLASKPNGSKAMKSSDPFADLSQKFMPNSMLDPRTAQIVAKLSPEDRLASLCTSEALAQLGSNPSTASRDALLPNGSSGGIISRTSFSGAGAAFRLGANWYNIDYKCSVDAGISRVVSFTFKIGGLVPLSEWQARKLDNRR
ncbi:DUF930 domain-containing protein [Phyllobacterium myrsinacearum]|uniref:DNA polymerase III gamma/tau subunit n=1 Tax=Phyllobacterium myrsinacearum TaxID=28101 RepID=A0A839EBW9_9HYPH|nr:DUF930 domain-containing protein [Phyllobacterium myrsinacearum]MBA8877411.1 DNA polymerase III gamma/tau subunit [Phyllobacterium myrsinacearum]